MSCGQKCFHSHEIVDNQHSWQNAGTCVAMAIEFQFAESKYLNNFKLIG